MKTRTDLVGPRASSAVRCPRQAVYQHDGVEEADVTERQQGFFDRGHAVEHIIRRELRADYRRAGHRTEKEVEIPWPAGDPVGVGHADLYVPHERLIVEMTSTAGCELSEHKALQAALYALNHPDATDAVVLSIDPSTWRREFHVVNVEGLRPQVESIMADVVAGIRERKLPERVCRHPHDGPAMFCAFVDHCFDGWEKPDADVLLDRALVDVAAQLADAEDDYAVAKAEAAEAERRRNDLRRELDPVVPFGEELIAGPVKIKRTTVKGRTTFALGDLTKSGESLPAHLQRFVKQGQPSERWSVERVAS